MGRYEKKKAKKSHRGLVTALVLVIVLAALILFVMPQVLYKLGNDDGTAESGNAVSVQEQEAGADGDTTASAESAVTAAVTFPLLMEDGKLEIESVFQFDGINPDCGNQEGNDIGAITVKNLSDAYLARAEITMTAENGQVLHFAVTDLPAGKAAMAFSQENASAEADAAYHNITCEAAFDAAASMNPDKISVSADGTQITLQNNTGTEITELVVYCRSTLGDQYFGGITYTYTVNNLPAYGTAALDAVDCILGIAEVVRIAINES